MSSAGVVYVAKNSEISHFTKVGYTTIEDRFAKDNRLSTVIGRWEELIRFPVTDVHEAERLAHRSLRHYRADGKRELFRISPRDAAKRVYQALLENDLLWADADFASFQDVLPEEGAVRAAAERVRAERIRAERAAALEAYEKRRIACQLELETLEANPPASPKLGSFNIGMYMIIIIVTYFLFGHLFFSLPFLMVFGQSENGLLLSSLFGLGATAFAIYRLEKQNLRDVYQRDLDAFPERMRAYKEKLAELREVTGVAIARRDIALLRELRDEMGRKCNSGNRTNAGKNLRPSQRDVA